MEDPGPTGYDSWSAQVRGVRDRLLRETRAAGLDDRTVDELVEQAAADYRDARVHAYIGILVERAVRDAMIRSNTDWLKCTLFTRSSGISMPLLANTPWRKMTRSLVMTKLVVIHLT